MSHDVIYFPSEKCFSDGELVCPMDPSEPSESIFVHRSQIASIGHICCTDITDNFSYELCQSAMDTFVDPTGDKKPTEAKTVIDPPIVVESTEAQTITDLPIEAQNNSDLPIVVEPIEAHTIIYPPIVVEPIEAQTIIDPPIVVEPIEAH